MELKQGKIYSRSFKMFDSVDHVSAKTGLTCVVNLSKAGAAFAVAKGTVSEIANGFYKVVLSPADIDTIGELAFYITSAGADDCNFIDQVVMQKLEDLSIVNGKVIAGSVESFTPEALLGFLSIELEGSIETGSVAFAIITNIVDQLSGAIALSSDPWDAQIPTGYLPGSAGFILGSLIAQAGSAMSLTESERTTLAGAILDLTSGVETGMTMRQTLRVVLAALAGKLSGAATDNIIIRDTNDSKDRISAAVDSSGNRTAITLDVT